MWGEIPLGKPFGIELRLHVLFFVTILLAVISQAWISGYAVGWAVVLAGPVLLITIYLHELGHCLASKAVNPQTSDGRLVHFDVSYCSFQASSFKVESAARLGHP